ncbi:helix-turn-helix domain-containing protein [Marinitenerispora sediminis]|uniref:XRE family transcriptional regulator n=1 Tax=Marinitenerispora sediminis TaxID=1931232 RepID=A0A368TA09_9ACTN|nr:XRE family transcriptional regulator [Marinitenerispora sediminis]RCV54213.1 XRE family transcriptional regulator [Marinitenerispora sediminis]RCV59512.1 XRE family transcriptional regulator [Marinitenerispora sediminis]RCV59767.1 XRE family transcriptional regulator [Marinitenerispora sediminis]
MADRTVAAVVADNVRSARARHGLSLDQLASRAGISKGALVAVEAGSGNPSLSTLVRLADALAVPVSAIVEPAGVPRLRVVHAGDIPPLWRGPAGGEVRLLLTTTGPAPVELWRWRMLPGERHHSAPHASGVHETVTVLDGTLVLTIGTAEETVPAGATAVFDSDVAHGYACAGDAACEFVMTVHLPVAPGDRPRKATP